MVANRSRGSPAHGAGGTLESRYHSSSPAATCPAVTEDPVSKTRRKKEMHALQSLGEQLVELPAERLAGLDLPERLRDAIDEARRVPTFGGRRRQMQYIGRLMRDVDPEPIRERLDALRGASARETALHHATEQWRERLLESDAALTDLVRDHPGADLQALRTLIRNARREREQQRPPRASRELFRIVRALLVPQPQAAAPGEDEPDAAA